MEYRDIKRIRDDLLMAIAGTARTVPLEDQFKIVKFLDDYLHQKDLQRKEWSKLAEKEKEQCPTHEE